MNKIRMGSIIAASLLTATAILTGCGGGGSSIVSNVSSSSSSSVSTSSATATKIVKVSDGYVLGAIVNCGVNQAVAIPENSGAYEFPVASCAETMVSKDGYIDINGDGKITKGEPTAPTMKAPKDYNNINPFTHFLAEGVSLADLESATELNAAQYNNFDIDIPSAKSFELAKQAALLSAAIAYINSSNQNISSYSITNSSSSSSSNTNQTEGILPGPRGILPGPDGTAAHNETNKLTYQELIARLKNGEKMSDIIPNTNIIENTTVEEYQKNPHIFDIKLRDFLPGACMEEVCVSTQTSSMSSETSSTSECPIIPGVNNNCNPSTSSETSSATNNNSTGSILPGPSN